MSDPFYYCETCKMEENVLKHQYGRGFPPDKAKRALEKRHKNSDCSDFKPAYQAGFGVFSRPTGQ